MKKCRICKLKFEEKHFNQRYCSEECKGEARKGVVKKYKQSKKGLKSRQRWYKNPRRVAVEKRYRSKPKARALMVKRVDKYHKKHPKKWRRWQKEYAYRRRGCNAGYMDWNAVKELEDLCVDCGTTQDLTIDHIIPLSKSGTNQIDNLQILCRSCNARKGNRI